MTMRALGSARADIGDMVFERLPPLDAAVTAVQARSETGYRADRENEHQCFASHLPTIPLLQRKGPKPRPKGPDSMMSARILRCR